MFWSVLAALVAIVAVSFKPFILPRLLDHVSWPLDESIGVIETLSVEELRVMFQDKRVLIVGGTRGVGFGLAKAVAQAGAKVTIVGRSHTSGENAVNQLGETNTRFV